MSRTATVSRLAALLTITRAAAGENEAQRARMLRELDTAARRTLTLTRAWRQLIAPNRAGADAGDGVRWIEAIEAQLRR